MKEIVIISGKGGTGKTSITGAFVALAKNCVIADCDVDAADLHLIIKPEIKEVFDFSGGKQAKINDEKCTGCARCEKLCRFGAIKRYAATDGTTPPLFKVDPVACEGCGVCAWFCHPKAIEFNDAINGQWFVSDTRFGTMVHAKLGIAEENSGKLVTAVRKKAKQIAEERSVDYIFVDGSPGTGCPVIASITGADLVVVVTEPTISGEHDLSRVIELAKYFKIPVAVCINKSDINPGVSNRIKSSTEDKGAFYVGEIPYNKAVTSAQVNQQTIIEFNDKQLNESIKNVWQNVQKCMMSNASE